ncbi:MAG: TIGR02597 family protein [Verrucomicrobiae bacterium]|nr:TIGR02597 family protein [Verrucomicrobiae bacterium]
MKTMMTLSKIPTKQSLILRRDSGRTVGQYSADGEQRTNDMQRATPDSSVKLALMLVALLLALPAFRTQAQPASDPAGFYRINCLSNSDTIVSIPFSRPAAANVVVDSVTGNEVTVKGAPGWTPNQFVYSSTAEPVPQTNTYYLRFLSGAKEGSYLPVTANGEDTLTLSLGGDDLSSVADGDQAAVIPYWTLATAFMGGKGAVASSSVLNPRTEVLIPDLSGVGINLSPTISYVFLTNAANLSGVWRQVGEGTVNKNDAVLLPDVYFIVRHNTTNGTVFSAQGSVPVSKLVIPMLTQTSTKQDNFVAVARPATMTLDESGLFQSGAFLASSSGLNPTDVLLVFDNQVAAKNKAPVETYYYLNTWRRVGSGTTNMNNQAVFVPGTGVIIRKNSTIDGFSSFWINSPNF